MTVMRYLKLLNKYAKCPECGCKEVGNGKGTVDADREKGYFKRTCHCGWYVEIIEE